MCCTHIIHDMENQQMTLFFPPSLGKQELGACPPLGYWDPFGMMAFQDNDVRKHRQHIGIVHIYEEGKPCFQELSCSCLFGLLLNHIIMSFWKKSISHIGFCGQNR